MSLKIASLRFTMAILTTAIATTSFALVDMRSGNYANTWVDMIVPGIGYDLQVAHSYNSKTIYSGIFGYGWCSDFETRIDKTADGNLKLTECGAGAELVFNRPGYGAKDIEAAIQKIIAASRAKQKQGETYYKTLAENLRKDQDLRASLSKQLNVIYDYKAGNVYYANGHEVDTLKTDKDGYVRALPDGSMQKFNANGQLTWMYDKSSNYLKLEYDKGTLKKVVDNGGRALTFNYDARRKLASITGPMNLRVEYTFKNLDDLQSIKNAWGNTYSFEYDETHNLTKASWPDGTSVALTYDKIKDLVLTFKDRKNCLEQYNYDVPKEDKMHYWSGITKTCDKDGPKKGSGEKEVVSQSKYEFFHKVRPDGLAYLSRTIATVNGSTTDISYHEQFGKPLEIRKNGEVVRFEYFGNGQVKNKNTPFSATAYEYDKATQKIAKVQATFFDDKHKKIAVKKHDFRYNKNGDLVFAQNTDGQKINLTYDKSGRIASMEDQAKKIVMLQYDDRFNKPSIITRKGMGSVKINYKANGEMIKPVSPEGEKIAMQVANTFANFLDVIAPASNEIFN